MKAQLIDGLKNFGFGLAALVAVLVLTVITQKVFSLENSFSNHVSAVANLALFSYGIVSLGKFIRSKLSKKA
jgi:hypothetical protein